MLIAVLALIVGIVLSLLALKPSNAESTESTAATAPSSVPSDQSECPVGSIVASRHPMALCLTGASGPYAPGSSVDVQGGYKNGSDQTVSLVTLQLKVPAGLVYVSGSTMIYDDQDPSGRHVDDGLAGNGMTVGSFKPSGDVYFTLFLDVADTEAFQCGENLRNLTLKVTSTTGSSQKEYPITITKHC